MSRHFGDIRLAQEEIIHLFPSRRWNRKCLVSIIQTKQTAFQQPWCYRKSFIFSRVLRNLKQKWCHRESLAQDRVRPQHITAMAVTKSKAPVALQHIKLRPGCCSWALGSDQGAASQRRNDRAHINDWFIHSVRGESNVPGGRQAQLSKRWSLCCIWGRTW